MLILVHFWHLLFILFFFGPVKLLGGFDGQNWNKKWVNEKCRCRTLEKKKQLHIQHYIFCMFFFFVWYDTASSNRTHMLKGPSEGFYATWERLPCLDG